MVADARKRPLLGEVERTAGWRVLAALGRPARCAVLRIRKHLRGVELSRRRQSVGIKRLQAELCVHPSHTGVRAFRSDMAADLNAASVDIQFQLRGKLAVSD
jgi:hypothetical protein